MNHLSEKIEKEFMPFVLKPGRYSGNELNVVKKDHSDKIKIALVYPDLYEIGMSYLGLAILYNIINKRQGSVAERAFAVGFDAENILREKDIPIFSLESHTPLKEFDIIGFSLSYELTYTNVLNILNLAKIPVYSSERKEDDPLILAGGFCTSNPEPMADFIDLFVLGDGEEVINEILDLVKEKKSIGASRKDLIYELSKLSGVYVPSFYQPEYDLEGDFEKFVVINKDAPERIKIRTLDLLKTEYYSLSPILPFVEIIHDRLTVEIMRGCPHKCRFCQAGFLYHPRRERPKDEIIKQTDIGIANTGWEEVSLASLSSTDYRSLEELIEGLKNILYPKRVSISLPSLYPGSFPERITKTLAEIRKTGLTFAPEAGTQRLRDVIGKRVKENEILKTVETVYSSGWNLLKLYFMIGLPTETEDDLFGIVDLIKKVLKIGKKIGPNKFLNVSLSPFIPKPHTPFQWEKIEEIDFIFEKIYFLRRGLKDRNLNLRFRNPKISFLEGIIGRGDRRMCKVIYSAWERGAKLDAWMEHFNYDIWKKAFEENEIDLKKLSQAKNVDKPLPWDHLETRIKKEVLKTQKKKTASFLSEDLAEKESEFFLKKEQASESKKNSFDRKKKRRSFVLRSGIAKTKVRLKWKKEEEVRFTSHLDVIRMFERAVRRSGIRVAYSLGFNPHQKIAFGPPLPLGFVSDSEYLDLQLEEPYKEGVFHLLNSALPQGFRLLQAKPIFGKTLSLSSVINSGSYVMRIPRPKDVLQDIIEKILSKKNFFVKRMVKGQQKELDIRYNILELSCKDFGEWVILKMVLRIQGADFARPEEILSFGFGLNDFEIKSLIIKRDGLYVLKDEKILTPMDLI